jgi:hypothetical protein
MYFLTALDKIKSGVNRQPLERKSVCKDFIRMVNVNAGMFAGENLFIVGGIYEKTITDI